MNVPFLHFALCLAFGAAGHQGTRPDLAAGTALFGWPWGTARTTIEQQATLEPLHSGESGVRRFRTDITSLGDATLWECDFEFVLDRYAGVVITTRGRGHSLALLRELRRLFGPGQEEDPRGFGWLNVTTHAHYDEDSAGDAYVYIYARRLYPAPSPGTPEEDH